MSSRIFGTQTIFHAAIRLVDWLFFYVKKSHIGSIPGLQEYADFFVSDAIAGPGGPLATYGLVPDPKLADVQKAVAAGTTMAAK